MENQKTKADMSGEVEEKPMNEITNNSNIQNMEFEDYFGVIQISFLVCQNTWRHIVTHVEENCGGVPISDEQVFEECYSEEPYFCQENELTFYEQLDQLGLDLDYPNNVNKRQIAPAA